MWSVKRERITCLLLILGFLVKYWNSCSCYDPRHKCYRNWLLSKIAVQDEVTWTWDWYEIGIQMTWNNFAYLHGMRIWWTIPIGESWLVYTYIIIKIMKFYCQKNKLSQHWILQRIKTKYMKVIINQHFAHLHNL